MLCLNMLFYKLELHKIYIAIQIQLKFNSAMSVTKYKVAL